MKKLFKMFATILAVSVLTIGFASCANDSSDSSSSSSSAASSSASGVPATISAGAKATFIAVKGEGEREITKDNLEEGKKMTGKDLSAYIGKKIKNKNTRYYVFKDSEWVHGDYTIMTVEGKTVYEEDTPDAKGTYTITSGDFNEGVVALSYTHMMNWSTKTMEEKTGNENITIAGGKIKDSKYEYSKQ